MMEEAVVKLCQTIIRKKINRSKNNKVFTMIKIGLSLLLVFNSVSLFCQADHGLWTSILKTQVSDEGNVDYEGINKNPKVLQEYISHLQNNLPDDSWSKDERLAYWINAYNALTIDLVLQHYPVKSIKDIKKPWSQRLWQFGERKYSLNDIEHSILRKLDEPRIHFAIVCASISCPKLQNVAFLGETLDEQLTDATKIFLTNRIKNKITKNHLELSKIFKWFANDFRAYGGVLGFIYRYTEIEIAATAKITYLDYNWALND
jgi:hypothetical protein